MWFFIVRSKIDGLHFKEVWEHGCAESTWYFLPHERGPRTNNGAVRCGFRTRAFWFFLCVHNTREIHFSSSGWCPISNSSSWTASKILSAVVHNILDRSILVINVVHMWHFDCHYRSYSANPRAKFRFQIQIPIAQALPGSFQVHSLRPGMTCVSPTTTKYTPWVLIIINAQYYKKPQ